MAVGGYGRGELSPWSDVDLMFLCRDTSSNHLVQTVSSVLHMLWDLHLEVGRSVRSLEDREGVALRDLKTWTTLMDARLVAGDHEVFASFDTRVKGKLFRAHRQEFVGRLIEAVWERHTSYSRSPFLVEPHLRRDRGDSGTSSRRCGWVDHTSRFATWRTSSTLPSSAMTKPARSAMPTPSCGGPVSRPIAQP